MQMSGGVPDIIFLAQIALKFGNRALIVDNRGLLLFWSENLANLLGLSDRYITMQTLMIKLLRNVMSTMPRELGYLWNDITVSSSLLVF